MWIQHVSGGLWIAAFSVALFVSPSQVRAQSEALSFSPCAEDVETILHPGDRTQGCRIEAPTETDVFRFAGIAGETLRILILHSGSATFDPTVQIFNPGGDSIALIATQRTLTLDSTGDYRLVVTDSGSNATGDYTLVLEPFPETTAVPAIPTVVPDGSPDGPLTVSGMIAFASDHDFFVFRGVAGETVRFLVLDNGSTSFTASVQVFNPEGDSIGLISTQRTLTLDASGDYLLVVTDLGFDAIGDYTVGVERFPKAFLTPIAPYMSASPSAQGRIESIMDHDFFALRGAAGTTVRLLVSGQGAPQFLPSIQVFDPNGKSIALLATQRDLTLDLTGDYLLVVTDLGFDATGDYEFTITCLFGECPTETPPPLASIELVSGTPRLFTTVGGTFETTLVALGRDGAVIRDRIRPELLRFVDLEATPLSQGIEKAVAATMTIGIKGIAANPRTPVTLAFLIDSSVNIATADPQRLRVEALKRTLTLLRADAQVAILDVGAGVTEGLQHGRLLQPFTTDNTLLEAALEQLTADDARAPLIGASLDALNLLEANGTPNPAIFMLASGSEIGVGPGGASILPLSNEPGLSDNPHTAEDVITRAAALNATICVIRLAEGIDDAIALQAIASATGCTAVHAPDAMALNPIASGMMRGLIDGRIVVTNRVRFDPPLTAGLYVMQGGLGSASGGADSIQHFEFVVPVVEAVPEASGPTNQ